MCVTVVECLSMRHIIRRGTGCILSSMWYAIYIFTVVAAMVYRIYGNLVFKHGENDLEVQRKSYGVY